MHLKNKEYVFLFFSLVISGGFMFTFANKLLNKENKHRPVTIDLDDKAENQRIEVINQLKQEIDDLRIEIRNKNKKIVSLPIGKYLDEYLTDNSEEMKGKKIILINSTDEKFTPGKGTLNSAITKYIQDKKGLTDQNKWVNFKKINHKKYKNRIAYSEYDSGYILHIVAFTAKDITRENQLIESVSDMTEDLIKESILKFSSEFFSHSNIFFVPYISVRLFANHGKDVNGIEFSKREFRLRSIKGVYQLINRYNGPGELILNKGPRN